MCEFFCDIAFKTYVLHMSILCNSLRVATRPPPPLPHSTLHIDLSQFRDGAATVLIKCLGEQGVN